MLLVGVSLWNALSLIFLLVPNEMVFWNIITWTDRSFTKSRADAEAATIPSPHHPENAGRHSNVWKFALA